MKRILLISLLCGLLAAGGGCGMCHGILCCPFGPGTMPGGCCEECGASLSDCGGCSSGCGDGCGVESCDSCGTTCGSSCGGCDSCSPCGLLSCISGLFSVNTWCGDGCGDVYWGDFHGDPPDMCDPCDNHGNYSGSGGCSTCGQGHDGHHASQAVSGGCETCGKGQAQNSTTSTSDTNSMGIPKSQIISETVRIEPSPAKVAKSSPATVAKSPKTKQR